MEELLYHLEQAATQHHNLHPITVEIVEEEQRNPTALDQHSVDVVID